MLQCLSMEQGVSVEFVVIHSRAKLIAYRVQLGLYGNGSCMPSADPYTCSVNISIKHTGIFTVEILADGEQASRNSPERSKTFSSIRVANLLRRLLT